jgi:hypothetical protein
MATSRLLLLFPKNIPCEKAVISAIGKIIPPLKVIAVCDDLLLGLSIYYSICDFEIDKFDSIKKK